MIKTLTKSNFRDEFSNYNRNNQFTYEGLGALYDFLEEIDEKWELDVIALCCEYTEYADLTEFNTEHDTCETIEEIHEKTLVIMVGEESFIIAQF